MSGCIPNDLGSTTPLAVRDFALAVPWATTVGPMKLASQAMPVTTRRSDFCHVMLAPPTTCHVRLPATKTPLPSCPLGDIHCARDSGKVTRVIVVAHGAGRNDDYFYLQWQSWNNNQRPRFCPGHCARFPVPTDTDLELSGGGIAVRWSGRVRGGLWWQCHLAQICKKL
jgi:hypothetical protein